MSIFSFFSSSNNLAARVAALEVARYRHAYAPADASASRVANLEAKVDALEEKLALLVAQAHMEFKPVTAKWKIDAAETSGQ